MDRLVSVGVSGDVSFGLGEGGVFEAVVDGGVDGVACFAGGALGGVDGVVWG